MGCPARPWGYVARSSANRLMLRLCHTTSQSDRVSPAAPLQPTGPGCAAVVRARVPAPAPSPHRRVPRAFLIRLWSGCALTRLPSRRLSIRTGQRLVGGLVPLRAGVPVQPAGAAAPRAVSDPYRGVRGLQLPFADGTHGGWYQACIARWIPANERAWCTRRLGLDFRGLSDLMVWIL